MRRLLVLLVLPLLLAACGQQTASPSPSTEQPAPTTGQTIEPVPENTDSQQMPPETTAPPTPQDRETPQGQATPEGQAAPQEVAGADAADQYCAAVDEFLKASRKAAEDPLNADTKALQEQIQNLQAQAAKLAGELFDNPEGITQVTQCTQKLREFSEAS